MRDSVQRAVDDDVGSDTEMLYLFGGVALAIFGAGLILSNRSVRQLLGQVKPGALMQAAVPDLQRYLKLRAM
jgi:hypothetical protein